MSSELKSLGSVYDRRDVYAHLVNGFRSSAGRRYEDRWRWLMAGHIVGQMDFRLHVHSHWMMLRFAASNLDMKEAAGQMFRLLLVPIGHALDRLPTGNIGRATVSAFLPMTLSPEMRQLVAQARRSVKTKGVGHAENPGA